MSANVLTHGTGALNIDACRIEGESIRTVQGGKKGGGFDIGSGDGTRHDAFESHPAGRWPANVILDEDAAAALDAMSGERKTGVAYKHASGTNTIYGAINARQTTERAANGGDTGGASRFFLTAPIDDPDAEHLRFAYVAKASRSERNAGLEGMPEQRVSIGDERPSGGSWERRAPEKNPNYPQANGHPTVKPLSLMRWLARLICPPGGVVLDPFAGSFTTGVACILEGFDFIGIEQEEEYVTIGRARMEHFRRHGENWKTAKSAAIPLACGTADTSQSSLTAGSLPQQMRILERGECDEQAS